MNCEIRKLNIVASVTISVMQFALYDFRHSEKKVSCQPHYSTMELHSVFIVHSVIFSSSSKCDSTRIYNQVLYCIRNLVLIYMTGGMFLWRDYMYCTWYLSISKMNFRFKQLNALKVFEKSFINKRNYMLHLYTH